MNKTGQMIEFEEETGGYAIVTVKVGFAELQFPSEVYVEWLEAELLKASVKATAYYRLMSGGLTMKELANILGKPVAIDIENRLLWFPKKPEIGVATWIWYDNQFGCFGEELPDGLINFTGDWRDSLTLPDGWEEK